MQMIAPAEAVDADSLTWLSDDAEWATLRVRLWMEAQATPEPLPPIEKLRARGDYHFITPLPGESWECFHLRVRTEEALLSWLLVRLAARSAPSPTREGIPDIFR